MEYLKDAKVAKVAPVDKKPAGGGGSRFNNNPNARYYGTQHIGRSRLGTMRPRKEQLHKDNLEPGCIPCEKEKQPQYTSDPRNNNSAQVSRLIRPTSDGTFSDQDGHKEAPRSPRRSDNISIKIHELLTTQWPKDTN